MTEIFERYVKLKEADKSFDIAYWQSRPASERFKAGWELVETAWMLKGRDKNELRLQRHVEKFERIQR